MNLGASIKNGWARSSPATALVAVALSLAACSGAQSTTSTALPPPVAPPSQDPPKVATPRINGAVIDAALSGFVERGQIAGAEALVFKDGHEVYYGAFGFADREA